MKPAQGYLLLVLCLLSLEIFSQSAVCSYKYRKRITFNPAQVSGPSDLANFPALINISSDNDLRTVANLGHVENTNGYDIIFTADDGVTVLDQQLESYTATSGALVTWVRIPLLSTTYSTTIYMYYGNTAIAADQSVNSTWNSAYKGVWHFNNNVFSDGTSNGNNATNNGSTNMTAAKIAGGRTMPGTGTDYIQIGLNGMSGGNGTGSIAFWGLVSTYAASTYFFGETTNQTGSYANRVQLYIGDASGNLYLGIGGNHSIQTNVQLLSLNTWYHIALTWAANTPTAGTGNYSVFVNGVQKGSGSYSAFTAIHTFGDMGNDGNAGQRTEEITGSVDEVRTTSTTLSSDWILTEYNSQNSPSTFYSVSTEPKVWNGGTSTNYNTAANWLGNNAPVSGDDVLLNNGTNQPTLQGNEQVKSIFIRTGATLSLGANNLSVRSDITSCGVISGNTGMVTLNATSSDVQTQNISGSGTYNLNNLVVNNAFSPSPKVVLNKDVNVAGGFTLTSGIVYTSSSNILALGTSATSTSGSANSFVSGPLSKLGSSNFVFPVGKGNSWRRIGLSGLSASATFRGEYFNTPYTSTTPVNAPLTDVSALEYWQMDLVSGVANASLTLYWENAGSSGINNCPDLTIARWNGSSWDERPGTFAVGSSCSGAGAGSVVSNTLITAFSPFTFGSKTTSLNPLPIELKEFKADCADNLVSLNWVTASEKNNAYFLLERSSDGLSWMDIHHEVGAGTSMTSKTYFYKDPEPVEGLAYYRLSQADAGGNIQVYKTLAVSCSTNKDYLQIYPNPAGNDLYAEIALSQNYGEAQLKIIDALGRTCLEQSLNAASGKQTVKILHHLLAGSYTVLLVCPPLVFPAQKLILK